MQGNRSFSVGFACGALSTRIWHASCACNAAARLLHTLRVDGAEPDGSRWKNVSIVQMTNTCGRFHEEMVRRHDGGELTVGQLLTADMVAAYCDGDTENRRHADVCLA